MVGGNQVVGGMKVGGKKPPGGKPEQGKGRAKKQHNCVSLTWTPREATSPAPTETSAEAAAAASEAIESLLLHVADTPALLPALQLSSSPLKPPASPGPHHMAASFVAL